MIHTTNRRIAWCECGRQETTEAEFGALLTQVLIPVVASDMRFLDVFPIIVLLKEVDVFLIGEKSTVCEHIICERLHLLHNFVVIQHSVTAHRNTQSHRIRRATEATAEENGSVRSVAVSDCIASFVVGLLFEIVFRSVQDRL
jgi:hypothetical protein